MMNDEITLIKTTQTTNDMGDVIDIQERTTVLCEVESITRNEFYHAAKIDMQPEIMFVINRYDYSGESEVEYEGKLYDVIRSYKPNHRNNPQPMDIDRLELVCKIGRAHA